jgi:predicted DNA-binding ribbon-helix-helix protein
VVVLALKWCVQGAPGWRWRAVNPNWSWSVIAPVEIASRVILALQKLRCYNGIMTPNSVHSLTDEQLLLHLQAAAEAERNATVRLIALLAEMDVRRLYLAQGYSSLFVYCTRWLHLSEHAAYGRIEAAWAARKFPVILDLLSDGSITLTTVCLLASHLTVENQRETLQSVRHKSKREVEQQVAALRPMPPVPSLIRELPQPSACAPRVEVYAAVESDSPLAVDLAATEPPPSAALRPLPPVVTPLAPERYKIQVTISRETHDRLRRVQDLLRHIVPNGDPAVILDRALTLLLADLERRKLAKVVRPEQPTRAKTSSRHVPADVRREVWSRDGGQCAFVGASGRCVERGFLEFHHVIPFADGGPTTADNLQLRCRAHNAYEANEYFGSPLLRERSISYGLGLDRVTQATSVRTPDSS